MSDRIDSKKMTLTPAEAARLLRELATRLEDGTLAVGDAEAVPGERLKVKLAGKSKDGTASLALKVQWDCGTMEEGGAGPEGVPSYKSIKKRMGSTFKKIRADLREGRIPDAELAALFDEDAERMLHYPKKGELEDIKVFREISAAFAAAVKKGDADAVARQVEALHAAEKSCHKKYK